MPGERLRSTKPGPHRERLDVEYRRDVLLTHSYHLAYDPKQWQKMQPFPPLGTLYAATLLHENQISVAVFDTMLRSPELFEEELALRRPRVVAIYEDSFNFLSKMCLTRMREVAFEMASAAHRHGAFVVAHGSDATDHADLYLASGVDLVITGEGEWTLLDTVLNVLNSRTAPHGVTAGVSRPDAMIPQPDRSLIDIGPYREAWKQHGYFMMNLVTSRGCPFRCNWCAKPIFGSRYHSRPPLSVAEEMLHIKHKYAADRLWFADDIFGLDHRWLREFADAVVDLDAVIPFKVQARADLMSAENARNLKRAGCSEVWMGVESGSQKVLDAMEKGLLVEEVRVARNELRAAGIRAGFFLQFGYPGEVWDDILATIKLVRETRPDDIGVSVSYPLPNTRFYERVQQQLGAKRNWSHSADLTVMFRGAYTDEFYRALRNALHAEVDSWSGPGLKGSVEMLWQQVARLEPISRNRDATLLDMPETHRADRSTQGFLPLSSLRLRGGEV